MGQFSNLLVAYKLQYVLYVLYVALCYFFYNFLIKNPTKKIQQMLSWPTTKAKIITINTDKTKLNSMFEYEYNLDNKKYSGNMLSCVPIVFRDDPHLPKEVLEFKKKEVQVGQELDVYYDPRNPHESYLIKYQSLPGQSRKQFNVFLILGVITLLLFGI